MARSGSGSWALLANDRPCIALAGALAMNGWLNECDVLGDVNHETRAVSTPLCPGTPQYESVRSAEEETNECRVLLASLERTGSSLFCTDKMESIGSIHPAACAR